jgi:hypothetical protein
VPNSVDPAALTLRQAARAYRVSPGLLRTAVRDGSLPAFRIGARWLRVLPRDIEAWLANFALRPTADAEALALDMLERERNR